jgi:hypothetical protein
VSPSGKYILSVPIEHDPRRHNLPYWRVTISDASKNVLIKDDSDFVAQLNVYWLWDSEDRVWLYNSDTSRVYFWELSEGKWRRVAWGYGKTKETAREVYPPSELYPDYAR